MSWDARKISDHAYHRRRAIYHGLILLVALGSRPRVAFESRFLTYLLFFGWLGIIGYCSVGAIREARLMRRQANR